MPTGFLGRSVTDMSSPTSTPAHSYAPPRRRIHGLDALRGGALLLGIVLHAVMPFAPGIVWLVNDVKTTPLALSAMYVIHLFRMTLFMVLAGYFGAMVVARRGAKDWVKDRAKRILLPAIVFWPFAVATVSVLAVVNFTMRDLPAPTPPPGAEGSLLALFGPGHLWFLWTLMQSVVVVALVRAVVIRLAGAERAERMIAGLGRVLATPVGPVIAAIPYLVGLLVQGTIEGGIMAPFTILPEAGSFISYLGAFVVGWALFRADGLPQLARWGWPTLVVAVGLTGIGLLTNGATDLPMPVGAALIALTGWTLTCGLIGVCVAHLRTERPVVRYLADASYWMYLFHLPLLVAGEILMADLQWPIVVKLLVVVSATTAVLLGSYHLLVRERWIGRWINGSSRRSARSTRSAEHPPTDEPAESSAQSA